MIQPSGSFVKRRTIVALNQPAHPRQRNLVATTNDPTTTHRYLQKPSFQEAEASGAFLPRNPEGGETPGNDSETPRPEVAIDSGVVVFSGAATSALAGLAYSETFKGCTARGVAKGASALRLELYSDLLLALKTGGAAEDTEGGGTHVFSMACYVRVPTYPLSAPNDNPFRVGLRKHGLFFSLLHFGGRGSEKWNTACSFSRTPPECGLKVAPPPTLSPLLHLSRPKPFTILFIPPRIHVQIRACHLHPRGGTQHLLILRETTTCPIREVTPVLILIA